MDSKKIYSAGVEKRGTDFPGKFNSYEIWQIKDAFFQEYAFLSMNALKNRELSIEQAHYELVYSSENPIRKALTQMNAYQLLENICRRFNISHPRTYRGRSVSVSDVLILISGDTRYAFYVDSYGYENITSLWMKDSEQTFQLELTELSQNVFPVNAKDFETACSKLQHMYDKGIVQLSAEDLKETTIRLYKDEPLEETPKYAVVVTYTFSSETCVIPFDDYQVACSYMEQMWQHCYNEALKSPCDDSESDIDEDGTWHEEDCAQIKWGHSDNCCRIWRVVPMSEPMAFS